MEIAPGVNEAVHYFIEELAGIEADLQLKDLIFFCKKILNFLIYLILDRLLQNADFSALALV